MQKDGRSLCVVAVLSVTYWYVARDDRQSRLVHGHIHSSMSPHTVSILSSSSAFHFIREGGARSTAAVKASGLIRLHPLLPNGFRPEKRGLFSLTTIGDSGDEYRGGSSCGCSRETVGDGDRLVEEGVDDPLLPGVPALRVCRGDGAPP